MQQQLLSKDYAFLFAGQTSIGDEKVSDEAINLAAATLAAGYRGVWKKRDMSRISKGRRFDVTTLGVISGEIDESEVPRLDHIHTEETRKGFRDMYNPQVFFWVFWFSFSLSFLCYNCYSKKSDYV